VIIQRGASVPNCSVLSVLPPSYMRLAAMAAVASQCRMVSSVCDTHSKQAACTRDDAAVPQTGGAMSRAC